MADRTPQAKQLDQSIKHGQTLTETWTVEYTRPHLGKPIEARLWWPHHTIYAMHAKGDTVEEARLELVRRLAAAIADDENPHGDNDG